MAYFAPKGLFIDPSVERIIRSKSFKYRSRINIYARRSAIPRVFMGRVIHIYTGKQFFNTYVHRWMVGRKFGEFATTKRLGATIHDSKRNQKRRAKLKNR
jgi:ribosomal protein S19